LVNGEEACLMDSSQVWIWESLFFGPYFWELLGGSFIQPGLHIKELQEQEDHREMADFGEAVGVAAVVEVEMIPLTHLRHTQESRQ